MNLKTLVLVALVMVTTQFAAAQHILCGYDLAVEKMEDQYPSYRENVDQLFEKAQRHAIANRGLRSSDNTYTIPVVIHVVWKEDIENLEDSILLSQIDVLNEDFRRMNEDAINIRPEFADIVGDAGIEFDLIDIIRVQTEEEFSVSLTGLPDNVKQTAEGGSDAMDTDTHLNIWICQIQPISIGPIQLGQVLGYAYPPADLDNWPEGQSAPSPELDGVVIDYRAFGRNNPNELDVGLGAPIIVKGRTTTHEVGHYLGLRHIWGDGGGIFGGDSCGEDDGIEDTPNAGGQSQFDCDLSKNTCTGGSEDLPDMVENYMDYASEDCMNSFTVGQIELMRSVLEINRPNLAMINTDTTTVDTTTVSASFIDLSDQLNVFPNPTSSKVYFASNSIDLANYNLNIYTLLGKKINTGIKITNNQLDLSAFDTGVYFIKLENNKHQIVKKISIVK